MEIWNDILARLGSPEGLAFAVTHCTVFVALGIRGYMKKYGDNWEHLDGKYTQDWLYQMLPGLVMLGVIPHGFWVPAAIFVGLLSGVGGKGFAAELRKLFGGA